MRKRQGPTAPVDQIVTLLELLKARAAYTYVPVPSSALGRSLGLSQQAASNRLVELEGAGLVERRRSGRGLSVKLTERGLDLVYSFYGALKGEVEGQEGECKFTGTLFRGLGEGAYYISHSGYAKQFVSALGFEPFPGTLNLRLTSPVQVEQRRQLQFLKGVEIHGFEDGRRTFGPAKCFRAEVGAKYPGAVLAIERTHYDDSVLEIISPVNLRRAMKLKDGDQCEVSVFLT